MRIISDFHDYYDGAMGYGIDKSVVYIRKEKKINTPPEISKLKFHRAWERNSVRADSAIVLVCGKLYPCIRIDIFRPNVKSIPGWYKEGNIFLIHCFSTEEVIAAIKQICPNERKFEHQMNMFLSDFVGDYIIWEPHEKIPKKDKDARRYYLDKYFSEFSSDALFGVAVENQWKILYSVTDSRHRGNRDDTYLDCSLEKLTFQKVMDPYAIFQELSMYIGGILPGEDKQTIDISDEDMAAKKGFNKQSFRKQKGEKKPRRR